MISFTDQGFLQTFQGTELPRRKVNFEQLKREIALLTGVEAASLGIVYSEGGTQTIQSSGRRINELGESVPERRETKVEIPATLTVTSAHALDRKALVLALRHHSPEHTDAELFEAQQQQTAANLFLENLKSVWPDFVRWLSMGSKAEPTEALSGRSNGQFVDRGKT